MGSEHDMLTHNLHVIGGIHWLSASLILSPLNEPLIFRMLEVKIIQSK